MSEGEITFTIDPDKLTIGFMEDMEEAQTSGKFSAMITVYADLFGVDRAIMRKMTLAEFRAVTDKIIKAVSVPNASG